MTIAYWCVLLAGLMPILTVSFAKVGGRGDDNHDPRAWLEKQSGFRRRADYAHRNHFEAFPFFAAAVIIAQQVHAAQTPLNILALVFIAARLAYTAFYLTDKPSFRSAVWFVAYLSIVGIFVLAGMAQ
ncbi:MAPEG family protein [Glaciimonas soli]|uniref:MAPEG superfamily protein n=1 Tax=Glaciimonas soli TaxID=2590999 RepID=A0A843YZA4_9BURK|nr:MAPEG family protein [Glaciimonas soli]MQR01866.1 hypothetical protein [Glaciimonas soli]